MLVRYDMELWPGGRAESSSGERLDGKQAGGTRAEMLPEASR